MKLIFFFFKKSFNFFLYLILILFNTKLYSQDFVNFYFIYLPSNIDKFIN